MHTSVFCLQSIRKHMLLHVHEMQTIIHQGCCMVLYYYKKCSKFTACIVHDGLLNAHRKKDKSLKKATNPTHNLVQLTVLYNKKRNYSFVKDK